MPECLAGETRENADHAMFAGTHVGIFPVNDGVAQVYLHLVSPGRHVQNLGMVVARS